MFIGPIGMPTSSKRDRRKNRWCGVRVSSAGLMFCEAKLRLPNESAAAKALEVDNGREEL